jgi:hypothetical protein
MTIHTNPLRIILAFFIAVFVAIFSIPTMHCAALAFGLSHFGSCSASMNGYLYYGMFFGLPPAVLLGIPVFLFFRKRGWLKGWQVILGGCLAGFLFGLILGAIDSFHFGWSLILGAFGALAGAAFWFIGLWLPK